MFMQATRIRLQQHRLGHHLLGLGLLLRGLQHLVATFLEHLQHVDVGLAKAGHADGRIKLVHHMQQPQAGAREFGEFQRLCQAAT